MESKCARRGYISSPSSVSSSVNPHQLKASRPHHSVLCDLSSDVTHWTPCWTLQRELGGRRHRTKPCTTDHTRSLAHCHFADTLDCTLRRARGPQLCTREVEIGGAASPVTTADARVRCARSVHKLSAHTVAGHIRSRELRNGDLLIVGA